MTTPAVETGEKPLSRPAKLGLMITAALVIALFYLFSLISVLLLLVCLAGEVLLFAALIRFGISRLLVPHMRRHSSLLMLFFRSFWTRSRTEIKVPLTEPDAPGLFGFLQQLSERLEVSPPREVIIEMNSGAHVRLNGFRRGAKATVLTLGYDLIAGLTERELEAVVAHEMSHAKLVRRGLRNWLNMGLYRAENVTSALSSLAGCYRRSHVDFAVCEGLLNLSDRCTRLAARLVATYSRQDEFDADRGAAAMCGPAPIRSSLLKLDDISAKSARISWNERVALLQRGTGFSTWLVEELASVGSATPDLRQPVRGIDRYSTHPSKSDRIAALPPDDPNLPVEPSGPAMQFFANPDEVASKIVTEVLRVVRIWEQRDTRRQRRWLRRQQRGAKIRPLQWAGVLVGGVAVIIGIVAWADVLRVHLGMLAVALLVLALAVGIYRLGRYRAKVALPIPDFETLHAAWENPDDLETRGKREEELFASLRDASVGQRFREKRAYLISQSFAALAKCDYLRAHVAARQCVKLDGKCVEGLLALAIAASAFRNYSQARTMLGAVQRITGLHSRSVRWGVGWSLFLLRDWAGAEAFLAGAAPRKSPQPSFDALLAISQANREKLESATIHARAVLADAPQKPERIQLVVNLLLDGGNLNEAQQLLAEAGLVVQTEPALMQCMVRLYLLQRNFDLADQWLEALRQQGIKGPVGIQLGSACETARRDEQAAAFYTAALRTGFYPEAHLGLSRLAIHRKDHATARKHIVSALNVDFTLGPKARGPLELFSQALGHIIRLEAPITDARAWTATMSKASVAGPVAKHSFLIFARDEDHAESFLKVIVDALKPGEPSLIPTHVTWKEAHRDQQPVGSVRPGIQSFWQ